MNKIKFDDSLELLEVFYAEGMPLGYITSNHNGDFWKQEDKSLNLDEINKIVRLPNEQVFLHNNYYRIDQPVTLQLCNSNQIFVTYDVEYIAQQHLN